MDKIKLAKRTIALLSSMIESGECHTSRSREMKDNAIEGLEQLMLGGVIVSEMRTSKEIIRLIELVNKIETEQSNKCVDMKLRDIVNTSFYRLKKVFDKQSI